MSINKNELTKEQIAKAMACKTVEELMELNVLAQLNPGIFLSSRGRRYAEKWLKTGKVAALGSDLHRAHDDTYEEFIKACSSLGEYTGYVESSMRRLLDGAIPLTQGNII